MSTTPPLDSPSSTPPSRTPRWLPLLALVLASLVCLAVIGGGAVLYNLGLLPSRPAPGTVTPTLSAFGVTMTPRATFALDTPRPVSTLTPSSTPSPTRTSPPLTPGVATPALPDALLDWNASLIGSCDLFEGENEVRKYGCESGAYVMQHKQATTRYAYYDTDYGDVIVDARGHFVSGEGAHEYGVVWRADADGTLYYVFVVTADGKYNVALYQNEKYTNLIPYTASPIVHTGTASNRFKVVARGSSADFFLNDEYVGHVNDSTIARGKVALFFYNEKPGATVAFDQLSVSVISATTPTPPPTPEVFTVPTPSPTSLAAATVPPLTVPAVATLPALTVPALTLTPPARTATPLAVAPGVYITALRLSPISPKRGQPVTFHASFLNTTGRAQDLRWSVEIWDADTTKKNSLGIADGSQQTIPAGTSELATFDNWKLTGGGPCTPLRARVIFVDDQSRRVPFARTNGSDLWLPFQVCP